MSQQDDFPFLCGSAWDEDLLAPDDPWAERTDDARTPIMESQDWPENPPLALALLVEVEAVPAPKVEASARAKTWSVNVCTSFVN